MRNTVRPPRWLEAAYPNTDIVLSSRIRLARNLKSAPFPHNSTAEQRSEIAGKLRETITSNDQFTDHRWIELGQLTPLERQLLVEEYIISPNFSGEVSAGRALTFNTAKTESLMINEEDHIRLQVIEPGFDLKKSWTRANLLDDQLEQALDFAFSPEFGYKTACPTNLGTALRASVMVHLPAHGYTDNLKNFSDYVANLGLSVRGIFGEGTNIYGHVVQVSNQSSQGLSEEDVLGKLERITVKIIEQENNLRDRLLYEERPKTEDRVWRDFGTLKTARILPLEEFYECFSMVRMGVQLGILPPVPAEILNQLMLFVRPAYLQLLFEPSESPEHLDWRRAELVREALKTS